jgi:hypothetical protein
MSHERFHNAEIGDGWRRGGGGTAEADTTATIVRRLLSNFGLMIQTYLQAGVRDLRLAVRDIVMSAVALGIMMMLGFYLIGLILTAAVLAIALVLPGWAAALVVFGAVLLVTGLLAMATIARIRRVFGRIRTTLQSAKEDVRWFRTRILRID